MIISNCINKLLVKTFVYTDIRKYSTTHFLTKKKVMDGFRLKTKLLFLNRI